MEFIRPKRISLGLDMAPLIDIVFQLLIFFMLGRKNRFAAGDIPIPQFERTELQGLKTTQETTGKT